LNKAQRIEVMDILVPLPDEEGRAYTIADNRRSALAALDKDPMVEPWVGTAWGEVQRYNTEQHWLAPIKSESRSERNTWRSLNGKTREADRQVVQAIEAVVG